MRLSTLIVHVSRFKRALAVVYMFSTILFLYIAQKQLKKIDPSNKKRIASGACQLEDACCITCSFLREAGDKSGTYLQVYELHSVRHCKIVSLICREEKYADEALSSTHVLKFRKPFVLHLTRSHCTPGSTSLPYLMHPRIYGFISNIACFGDVPHLSAYETDTQSHINHIYLLARAQAEVFFPKNAQHWNAWKQMKHIMSETVEEHGKMLVGWDSTFQLSVEPTLFPSDWSQIEPQCPADILPPDIADNHVDGSVRSLFVAFHDSFKGFGPGTWLNTEVRDLVRHGYTTKSGVRFETCHWSMSGQCDILFRHVERRQECSDMNNAHVLNINTYWRDSEMHFCPNSLSTSTWTTSLSCPHDISLSLPPKTWFDDDVEDRYYLASFAGTHYKDGRPGSVRSILRFLDSPEDRIMIYSHCHGSNQAKECLEAVEQERLELFKRKPKVFYYNALKNSTFCFCPKGRQPASFRWLESIFSGCIPVYISDPGDRYMMIPMFSRQIPWTKISLYFHGFMLHKIPQFLKEVSGEQKREMQRGVDRINRLFFRNEYITASKLFDELGLVLQMRSINKYQLHLHQ